MMMAVMLNEVGRLRMKLDEENISKKAAQLAIEGYCQAIIAKGSYDIAADNSLDAKERFVASEMKYDYHKLEKFLALCRAYDSILAEPVQNVMPGDVL